MPIGEAVAQQRDAEEETGEKIQFQQKEADSTLTQATEGAVTDAVPSEVEQRELEARLADPALYRSAGKSRTTQERFQACRTELKQRYADWEAQQSALERIG